MGIGLVCYPIKEPRDHILLQFMRKQECYSLLFNARYSCLKMSVWSKIELGLLTPVLGVLSG